jgi:hypothetical protein
MGGCFVCTSKPLTLNSRARLTLTRKDETLQALIVVRVVKPRIGMGVEFWMWKKSISRCWNAGWSRFAARVSRSVVPL